MKKIISIFLLCSLLTHTITTFGMLEKKGNPNRFSKIIGYITCGYLGTKHKVKNGTKTRKMIDNNIHKEAMLITHIPKKHEDIEKLYKKIVKKTFAGKKSITIIVTNTKETSDAIINKNSLERDFTKFILSNRGKSNFEHFAEKSLLSLQQGITVINTLLSPTAILETILRTQFNLGPRIVFDSLILSVVGFIIIAYFPRTNLLPLCPIPYCTFYILPYIRNKIAHIKERYSDEVIAEKIRTEKFYIQNKMFEWFNQVKKETKSKGVIQ